MGFRDLYSFNKAFISKLGWRLIDSPNALWVRLLKSKTWRVVEDGIRWNVGAGTHVAFWSDRWLRSGTILKDVIDEDIPAALMHASVRDLSDGKGSWSLDGAAHWIPHSPLREVSATLAGVDGALEDKPTWRWSHDGIFSTRTTYEAIATTHHIRPDPKWKKLGNGRVLIGLNTSSGQYYMVVEN
ncbi:hypothetical protein SESBI_31633 [Sesbania bispinosa]|nr:hypothetical protein SESBI_31633 [Sesbania bispinosa]